MSTAVKRLQAIEAGLTGKERAVLWLRAWREAAEPDPRIASVCPEKDRTEMDGWTNRVTRGEEQLFTEVVTLQEWTLHLDHALQRLVTARRYEGRIAELVAALAAEGVDAVEANRRARPGRRALTLTPLAAVPYGYRRGMKLWRGTLSEPEPEEPPPFGEIAERTAAHLREGLVMRSQELEACETVLQELCDEFDGEDMVHVHLREALDDWRAKLGELRVGFEREVGPLEVPSSEEQVTRVRDLFPPAPTVSKRTARR